MVTKKRPPAKKPVTRLVSETASVNIPKKDTLFFVLVKPDGMRHHKEIEEMFLKGFTDNGLKVKVLFSKVIKKGKAAETKPYGLASFYDKSDDWLTKYGKKIVATCINKKRGDLRPTLGSVKPEDVPDWIGLQIKNNIPEALVEYMSSGDMYAIIFSVNSSEDLTFTLARKFLGNIEPEYAASESVRGKYSIDSFELAWTEDGGPRAIRNVCHCSDSPDEVHREISVFLGRKIADKFFPEKQDSLKRLMKEMSKTK